MGYKKIVDYKITFSNENDRYEGEGFVSCVKDDLAEGWQPYESPFVYKDDADNTYIAQTMVKYVE